MLYLTWSWSFLCSLPNLFVWNVLEPWDGWTQCTTRFITAEFLDEKNSIFLDPGFRVAYHTSGVISVFWLPLCVITLLYAYIFVQLQRLGRGRSNRGGRNESNFLKSRSRLSDSFFSSAATGGYVPSTCQVIGYAHWAGSSALWVQLSALINRQDNSPHLTASTTVISASKTLQCPRNLGPLPTSAEASPQFRDRAVTYSNHFHAVPSNTTLLDLFSSSKRNCPGSSRQIVSSPRTTNGGNEISNDRSLSDLNHYRTASIRRYSLEPNNNQGGQSIKEELSVDSKCDAVIKNGPCPSIIIQQESRAIIPPDHSRGAIIPAFFHLKNMNEGDIKKNETKKDSQETMFHDDTTTTSQFSMDHKNPTTNVDCQILQALYYNYNSNAQIQDSKNNFKKTSKIHGSLQSCPELGQKIFNEQAIAADSKWRRKLSKSDVFSQTGLLVLVYLACWLPYFVGSLVLPSQLKILGVLIGMNAAVDPIIYAFKTET